MSELIYNNMHGTAEYSKEDKCWHGQILNIDDLITYESYEYATLRIAFKKAIEDWLKVKQEREDRD